jgi:hypothetical protein
MNCAPDWFATQTRYDGYHYYRERDDAPPLQNRGRNQPRD